MEQKLFEVSFADKKYPAWYVTNPHDAAEIIHHINIGYPRDTLFGIDIETQALPLWKHFHDAALSPHLSIPRLVQIFTGKSVVIFDCNFVNPSLLTTFLESRAFIAHYALFELGFFKKLGIRDMNIGCTHILAKLLFHATRPTDEGITVSLENLCEGYLKVKLPKQNQTSDWSVPDLIFEQIEYAALDAIAVLKLAEVLAPALSKFKLERYYKLCKDAQHPIAEMHLNGIGVDAEKYRELVVHWRLQLYDAKKDLQKITGLSEITPHTLSAYLADTLDDSTLAVWPRTDTGKLQTDSHAFAEFSYLDIVKPFAEFQKRKTLTSSFGMNLLNDRNPATNKIHATFKLCGARTGRLSCSNPNIQQLPREKSVRNLFIPDPGTIFVRADYSQIELRVAAEVSQDEMMLAAYRNGLDLHKVTASKITNKDINEITDEERQMAKAVNFGFLFGLGAAKFSHYAKKSYRVEVSSEDAQRAVNTFRQTYSGYRAWQTAQAKKGAETLYCRTPVGKLRRLDPENTYGTSMNTPVQGGAAECMLYALVALRKALIGLGIDSKLIAVVHDEIIVQCLLKDVSFVIQALKLSMREGFLEVFPQGITRDIAEVSFGNSWGEAKV